MDKIVFSLIIAPAKMLILVPQRITIMCSSRKYIQDICNVNSSWDTLYATYRLQPGLNSINLKVQLFTCSSAPSLIQQLASGLTLGSLQIPIAKQKPLAYPLQQYNKHLISIIMVRKPLVRNQSVIEYCSTFLRAIQTLPK